MYLVFFVLSCFAVLGESSPHYWSNGFPSYRPYKVNSWGYNYGYLPYNYYQPLKGKDSTMTERTACKSKEIKLYYNGLFRYRQLFSINGLSSLNKEADDSGNICNQNTINNQYLNMFICSVPRDKTSPVNCHKGWINF
jgi:hypothetical protein